MAEAAVRTEVGAIAPGTLRLLGGPGVVLPAGKRGRASVRPVRLRYAAVEKLSAFLQSSPPQVMKIIEVNERTAQRRKEQGALTAEESDRLARVARVTRRAVDALGDAGQAKQWLRRPSRALGGVAPLDLLGTDAGAELVTDELGRIEYGDLY
jgi:putative toxin-antitoxin system antitoxin component (TIGR02293 family)